MLRLSLLICSLAAAACTRIEVRSSSSPGTVLAALEGAWTGTWTSRGAAGSGTVLIQVRSFEDRPIVRLQIDNPCLQPRAYTFHLTGTHLELRAEGTPVFTADLHADKTMVGSYGCPEDAGSWQANWQHDLPAVGDVTGTWNGNFAALTPAVQGPFVLHLEQHWRDGFLVVDGTLAAPALGIAPIAGSGLVEWRATTFDLQFATTDAAAPWVQLAGVGEASTLRVVDGIATVAPDPRVPFRQALWQAVLQR